jgi:prephenate dehydrogenase
MKIAIIGGSGKMGRWFARFLKAEDFEVVITGRNQTKLNQTARDLGVAAATDNIAAIRDAKVILLSVPIEGFESVVREIGAHTRNDQIVIDLTSVKTIPVARMHEHIRAGTVLGGHPVFGPGAKDIACRSIILTPINTEETALAEQIKGYAETRGARVSLMTPEAHDELMAVILGLAHFIAIASADTLLSLDRLSEMGSIGGVTFKLLLTLTASVISEDPDFYASLQMSLPGLPRIEETFLNKVTEWRNMVAHGEKTEFARRMKSIKERFAAVNPELGSAYEDMYKIIEVLQKPADTHQ